MGMKIQYLHSPIFRFLIRVADFCRISVIFLIQNEDYLPMGKKDSEAEDLHTRYQEIQKEKEQLKEKQKELEVKVLLKKGN